MKQYERKLGRNKKILKLGRIEWARYESFARMAEPWLRLRPHLRRHTFVGLQPVKGGALRKCLRIF